MKMFFKGLCKIFCTLVSILLVLVLAVGGWFGFQGYKMYQEAVKETPISEKVESIRAMDHFTEYEDLPEIYIDAVISAEDKCFEKHHGVDCLAIGRAVWNDLRTLSFAEGGSTITQQLMKNEYFTQEKNWSENLLKFLLRGRLKISTARKISSSCMSIPSISAADTMEFTMRLKDISGKSHRN